MSCSQHTSRQIVAVEETHLFKTNVANSFRFGYNHQIVNNNQGLSALVPEQPKHLWALFRVALRLRCLSPNYAVFGRGAGNPLITTVGIRSRFTTMLLLTKERTRSNSAAPSSVCCSISGPFPIQMESSSLAACRLSTRISRAGSRGASPAPCHHAPSSDPLRVYVQDDWRWKPNLTLNLGLRYEMTSVPTETNGKIAVLRNLTDAQPICGVAVTGCAGTGPFFNNPTTKNFEPRIGFAWDPFRTGKMAVRGGAGYLMCSRALSVHTSDHTGGSFLPIYLH